MEHFRLECQLLEEKNRNESLQSYTSTISHEFRTPIGTSLMFLEQMLQSSAANSFNKGTERTINLIISQLNFLLSLVNDVLAMKQIEMGQFRPHSEQFSPLKVLDFIKSIFQPQCEMQRLSFSYEISDDDSQKVPDTLIGD